GLLEEPHRAGRQVVVGVLEGATTRVGDDEDPRGPPPSPVPVGAGGARLDHAVGDKVVQVAPDGGGREPETAAERSRGGRAEFQDEPRDLAPGAPLPGDAGNAVLGRDAALRDGGGAVTEPLG